MNEEHANPQVEDAEEDEPECRVCRGPAEEGRPLFKPCKCSGSIGLTHQDCLQSWLAVNNATKCELCGTTFRFANQYADNTPERLPAIEVLLGVIRNLLASWLPLWLRVAVAAALWLMVAPLSTALIYHGWMHGTMLFTGSNALMQMRWNILADELVSGAVLVALILFSFLSLMSFVDFLRAEWHDPRPQRDRDHAGPAVGAPPPRAAGQGGAAAQNQLGNRNDLNAAAVNEGDIDAVIWEGYKARERKLQEEEEKNANEAEDAPPGVAADGKGEEQEDFVNVVAQPAENKEEEAGEEIPTDADAGDDGDEQRAEEEEEDRRAQVERLRRQLVNLQQQIDQQLEEEGPAGEGEGEEEAPREDDNDDNDENNMNNANNNNDNDDMANDGVNDMNDLQNMLDDDPDGMDADLNIALDELLGVRGPLWIVVRNLLWLLAFNTLYLALFAFVPRVIGSMAIAVLGGDEDSIGATTSSGASAAAASNDTANATVTNATMLAEVVANATEALANATSNMNDTTTTTTTTTTKITDYSLLGIFGAVERESARLGTTFRLKDFVHVGIGYSCAAAATVLMRYLWVLFRFKSNQMGISNHGNNNNNNNNQGHRDDDLRERLVELNRVAEGGLQDNNNNNQGLNPQQQQMMQQQMLQQNNFDEDGNVALAVAVDVLLDAAASIVKVGVLLFLKMFLLPVMLGFCLDCATTSLFHRTFDEIILYAGRDLFSFLFLHWVAGISFMLLVTVSVLQLREVAHPNVLAHVIRPQEPQPDLLGNLLHDPLATHGKRLVLSLVIYVLLLVLQVRLPVFMFVRAFGEPNEPLWKLKFCYILTPRLQIPIELCIFHLCMLAFLEKNKNSIGEIQHYWLKFVCQLMNMTNSVLPHGVHHFVLVGSRRVFQDKEGLSLNWLWTELAKEPNPTLREDMIQSEIEAGKIVSPTLGNTNTDPPTTLGDTNTAGNRIIRAGSDYIRLPGTEKTDEPVLLPSRAGRYRLSRDPAQSDDEAPVIQVWEEVAGASIPRPPEGWDDLGAGGADVQGRWAWDREKKSFIEEGVARRTTLFNKKQNALEQLIVFGKIQALMLLSWAAATVASFLLLVSPLLLGRLLFSLMRLPENYVHDPFCFAIGSSVIFPLLRRLMVFVKMSDQDLLARTGVWLRSIQSFPLKKAVILTAAGLLWFGILPSLVGLSYDVLFLWPNNRFTGQNTSFNKNDLIMSWAFGNVLLTGWSACCVVGVLTREFWAAVFFNDANREEPAAGDASAWQGGHGRMSRFWGIWKAVLLGWEWDKVDRAILFDECMLPILRTLLSVLLVPGIVSAILVGWLQQTSSVSLIVRACTAMVLGLFAAFSCEDQVSSWFDAAHQTARDDRYLIGQLLMNYQE